MDKIRNSLFPSDVSFTTTELNIIAASLADAAVKKYFIKLASDAFRDINLSEPKEGESAESYLRRRAAVVGGLAVLENLLAIEPPKSAA